MKPGRFLVIGLLLAVGCSAAGVCAAGESSSSAGATELPWVERYRQALEIDPDNASLRYQLGLSLLASGDNQGAVEEFHRAYPALSRTVGINFNLGLAYTRLRDPDSALLYLEQAEAGGALDQPEIYPLTSALYNVALVYLDQGEQSAAIDLLRHVVKLAPDRRDILRLFGEVLFRAGQTPEAQEQLLRYLSLYPDDSQVRETLFALHYNRALELLEGGKPEEARKGFVRALEVAPDSPMAHYYLAYIDYQQKRDSEVIARLAGILGEFPEDIQRSSYPLLYNASLRLFQQGDLEQAERGLAPLVGGEAPELSHLALAGQVALRRADYPAARRYYTQVLALDPANPEALRNLAVVEQGLARELVDRGQVLYREGDLTGAYRLLVEARGLNPLDRKLLAYLKDVSRQLEQAADEAFDGAEQLASGGDVVLALAQTRQGLTLWPESARGLELQQRLLEGLELELARQLLEAQSLLALGEFPRAVEAFALLLEIDPSNEDARSGLERAHTAIEGELDERLAAAREALEVGELDAAAENFKAVLHERPGNAEALEGMQRIDALRTALIGDELQWARRASSEGDYAAAREHFLNVLRQHDTPPLRNEYLAFEAAVEKRLAGLLAAARQARADHDFRKALGHYREARVVAADPGSLDAEFEATLREADETMLSLLIQAREALEAGEAGKGVQLLRDVLRIEPSQAQALEMLASAREAAAKEAAGWLEKGRNFERLGREAQAREAYANALRVDPYLQEARSALDALALRARELSAAQVERLYLEGVALYTRGEYRQAIAHWQQVLEIDQGYDKARRNLAKAELKMQQLKERSR